MFFSENVAKKQGIKARTCALENSLRMSGNPPGGRVGKKDWLYIILFFLGYLLVIWLIAPWISFGLRYGIPNFITGYWDWCIEKQDQIRERRPL